MPQPLPEGLEQMDRLDLMLGRVARADSFMNYQLAHLWLSLVGVGMANLLMPTRIQDLVRQCKILVSHSDRCTAQESLWAKDVLTVAKKLTEERDQCLHQMWSTSPTSSDAYFRQSLRSTNGSTDPAEMHTMEEFNDLLHRYARIEVQLLHLNMLIGDHKPDPMPPWFAGWEGVRGLFDLTDDGGWRLHSQRPTDEG